MLEQKVKMHLIGSRNIEAGKPVHENQKKNNYESIYDAGKNLFEGKIPDLSKAPNDLIKDLLEKTEDKTIKGLLEIAEPISDEEMALDDFVSEDIKYLGTSGADETFYAKINKNEETGKIESITVYDSIEQEVETVENEGDVDAARMIAGVVDKFSLDSVSFNLLLDLGVVAFEQEPEEEEMGEDEDTGSEADQRPPTDGEAGEDEMEGDEETFECTLGTKGVFVPWSMKIKEAVSKASERKAVLKDMPEGTYRPVAQHNGVVLVKRVNENLEGRVSHRNTWLMFESKMPDVTKPIDQIMKDLLEASSPTPPNYTQHGDIILKKGHAPTITQKTPGSAKISKEGEGSLDPAVQKLKSTDTGTKDKKTSSPAAQQDSGGKANINKNGEGNLDKTQKPLKDDGGTPKAAEGPDGAKKDKGPINNKGATESVNEGLSPEAMERIDGLISADDLNAVVTVVKQMRTYLEEDGFEPEDIAMYLIAKTIPEANHLFESTQKKTKSLSESDKLRLIRGLTNSQLLQEAKIEKFWVVVNPSSQSELGDILWEVKDLAEFLRIFVGTVSDGRGNLDWGRYQQENWTLYDNESEAKTDAEARLSDRGANESVNKSDDDDGDESGKCKKELKSIMNKIHKATSDEDIEAALDRLSKCFAKYDMPTDKFSVFKEEAERKRKKLKSGDKSELDDKQAEEAEDMVESIVVKLKEGYYEEEYGIPEEIVDIMWDELANGTSFKEIVNIILDDRMGRKWFEKKYHGNEFDLRQELESIYEDERDDDSVDESSNGLKRKSLQDISQEMFGRDYDSLEQADKTKVDGIYLKQGRKKKNESIDSLLEKYGLNEEDGEPSPVVGIDPNQMADEKINIIFVEEREFDTYDGDAGDSGWSELDVYTVGKSGLLALLNDLDLDSVKAAIEGMEDYDNSEVNTLQSKIKNVDDLTMSKQWVYFDGGFPYAVEGNGSKEKSRTDLVFLYPEL